MEAGIRNLTLGELDMEGLRSLIAQGEPLFVERKVATPKEGLAPTVASFANTLGGWLLLGIADNGDITGFEEHGRSNLQDHLRHVLREEVDPLPPFLARAMELDGATVGVVRVVESSDTPHLAKRTGALYVREPGGKQPIRDHKTLIELARRGAAARERAATRFGDLPLVHEALRPVERLPEESVWYEHDAPPVLELIVLAAPLTVSGSFADRALAASTVEWCRETTKRLWHGAPLAPHWVHADAFARGFATQGQMKGLSFLVNLVVDAGGVVAARTAQARQGETFLLGTLADEDLPLRLSVVADTLSYLDAHGRAVVDLLARDISQMQVKGGPLEVAYPERPELHIGGELPIPAEADDINDLAQRWAREFGRAAGLPHWEP